MNSKTNSYLGFNDLPFMLVGIPIVGFLIPIVFFRIPIHEITTSFSYFVGSIIYTLFYWLGDRAIFIWSRKKYPGFQNYKRRILIGSALVLTYTLTFCKVTLLLVGPLRERQDFAEVHSISELDYNISSLFVTVTISVIYEAIYLLHLWKNKLVESEQLKKENLRSQLETLKNQVNPHFLFNSLNTLASVIPEDPDLAVEFVQKLSKVYRYILEIKDKELIYLKEELECIKAYAFLLDIRFGSSVDVKIDIDMKSHNKYVVPLSLQMLLENAIKHNIVSQKRPLYIQVTTNEEGQIMVKNNLQLSKVEVESTKTGLDNIKRRYQLLIGKEVQVRESAEEFCVVLPIIEAEEL